MLIQSHATQAAGSLVVGAIRDAAAATGTDFQYLLATAQVESGLNPRAAAAGSSARGLFQFIDQTWLTTLKRDGASLGYGRYAEAITRLPSGRYEVADPSLRRDILALRNDPAANAAMAGAFTSRNAEMVASRIGRAPTEGELYIAHFLGANGAARLITMAANTPGQSAASAFPGAARANRSIFYDREGNARSAAQVYGVLVGRYDTARLNPKGPAASGLAAVRGVSPAASASPLATGATSAAPAGMSSTSAGAAAVAASAPAFQSLFSNTRGQPVSPIIHELWTARPTVAAALTGQTALAIAPASASGSPLDLFADQPTDTRRLFGVGS